MCQEDREIAGEVGERERERERDCKLCCREVGGKALDQGCPADMTQSQMYGIGADLGKQRLGDVFLHDEVVLVSSLDEHLAVCSDVVMSHMPRSVGLMVQR